MNIKEYIESGILEMYVLGHATKEESDEVEKMASTHPEIKKEMNKIIKEYFFIKNSFNKYTKTLPFDRVFNIVFR